MPEAETCLTLEELFEGLSSLMLPTKFSLQPKRRMEDKIRQLFRLGFKPSEIGDRLGINSFQVYRALGFF